MSDDVIIEGSYSTPIAIGASVVIPIYLGEKQSKITCVQISAPGLAKTVDNIDVAFLCKKASAPAADIDILGAWTAMLSDSGPQTAFMITRTDLDMMYQDNETTPAPEAGVGAAANRWLWMKITNNAGNSAVTAISYRITKGVID